MEFYRIHEKDSLERFSKNICNVWSVRKISFCRWFVKMKVKWKVLWVLALVFQCWWQQGYSKFSFLFEMVGPTVNLLRRWVETVQLPFRNRYVLFQWNKILLEFKNDRIKAKLKSSWPQQFKRTYKYCEKSSGVSDKDVKSYIDKAPCFSGALGDTYIIFAKLVLFIYSFIFASCCLLASAFMFTEGQLKVLCKHKSYSQSWY